MSQDLPYPPQMGGILFFVYTYSKPVCLICNATVALTKKGNLERHFETRHDTRATRGISLPKCLYMPQKFETWKHSLQHLAWQLIFTKPQNPRTQSQAIVIASYRVWHVLGRHNEQFEDRDVLMETFLEAANFHFENFSNKT